MPEIISSKKIFSLLEVTASIQNTLASRYKSSFWVKAEMNKLNYYPHSGHCYPELVEKKEGKVIALVKSTLWKDDYLRINENFVRLVKTPLQDGISMLFCARITFDPVHGLALRILDIDPVFSLGELEREKQETISRLQQEGIFGRNKSLSFPLLPKRLAVISVQTSKGYADFMKVTNGNPWRYRFAQVLFPSLLQGDRAVASMMYQLERIKKLADCFDVVAIIRGGGGDVGLSCFNDYKLSREIALFPLPVLTGIGHATNETVVEMIAHKNAITPTELADYLIQHFHNYSVPIQRAEEILGKKARRILIDERQKIQHAVKYFRSVTDNVLNSSRHEVRQLSRDLFKQSNLHLLRQKQEQASLAYKLRGCSQALCRVQKLEVNLLVSTLRKESITFTKHENGKLDNLVRSVAYMHPENVLKRGYTITRVNGKAITSIREVKATDHIQTVVADGMLESEVKIVKQTPEV